MTFKEYEKEINKPSAKKAEGRVFNILRGGYIIDNYFYYPDGRGVNRVPISECENIRELED